MSFDANGYLGQEIVEYSKGLLIKKKDIYSIVEATNQALMELKDSIEIPEGDIAKVVVGLLLCRVVKDFQSCIILSRYGLLSSVKIIGRCMIENIIKIRAIEKDKESVSFVFLNDAKARERAIKNLIKYPAIRPEGVTENDLEKLKNIAKEAMQGVGYKEMTIKDFAEKAEMLEVYMTIYFLWSDEIHTSPSCLKELIENTDGKMIIEWGPEETEMDKIILTLCDYIVGLVSAMCRIMGIEEGGALGKIREEIESRFHV